MPSTINSKLFTCLRTPCSVIDVPDASTCLWAYSVDIFFHATIITLCVSEAGFLSKSYWCKLIFFALMTMVICCSSLTYLVYPELFCIQHCKKLCCLWRNAQKPKPKMSRKLHLWLEIYFLFSLSFPSWIKKAFDGDLFFLIRETLSVVQLSSKPYNIVNCAWFLFLI